MTTTWQVPSKHHRCRYRRKSSSPRWATSHRFLYTCGKKNGQRPRWKSADGSSSHKFQGQDTWNSARRKLWKHHSLHVPVAPSLCGETWNCVNSSVSWEKPVAKTPSFPTHQVSQKRPTTPRNIKRLHFISHLPPQTPRKVPLASRASDPWPPQRCNATLNICQVPPLVSGNLGGGSHGCFLMSLGSWLWNEQRIKYLQRSLREKL